MADETPFSESLRLIQQMEEERQRIEGEERQSSRRFDFAPADVFRGGPDGTREGVPGRMNFVPPGMMPRASGKEDHGPLPPSDQLPSPGPNMRPPGAPGAQRGKGIENPEQGWQTWTHAMDGIVESPKGEGKGPLTYTPGGRESERVEVRDPTQEIRDSARTVWEHVSAGPRAFAKGVKSAVMEPLEASQRIAKAGSREFDPKDSFITALPMAIAGSVRAAAKGFKGALDEIGSFGSAPKITPKKISREHMDYMQALARDPKTTGKQAYEVLKSMEGFQMDPQRFNTLFSQFRAEAMAVWPPSVVKQTIKRLADENPSASAKEIIRKFRDENPGVQTGDHSLRTYISASGQRRAAREAEGTLVGQARGIETERLLRNPAIRDIINREAEIGTNPHTIAKMVNQALGDEGGRVSAYYISKMLGRRGAGVAVGLGLGAGAGDAEAGDDFLPGPKAQETVIAKTTGKGPRIEDAFDEASPTLGRDMAKLGPQSHDKVLDIFHGKMDESREQRDFTRLQRIYDQYSQYIDQVDQAKDGRAEIERKYGPSSKLGGPRDEQKHTQEIATERYLDGVQGRIDASREDLTPMVNRHRELSGKDNLTPYERAEMQELWQKMKELTDGISRTLRTGREVPMLGPELVRTLNYLHYYGNRGQRAPSKFGPGKAPRRQEEYTR